MRAALLLPLAKTASWVIVEKATGRAVFETFSDKIADLLNRNKYEAVPILKWLQSINRPSTPPEAAGLCTHID